MVNRYVGGVCNEGHIIAVANSIEGLVTDSYCQNCGGPIHHVCPNCEDQYTEIRVYRRERDDGSEYWTKPDNCHNCGSTYPWAETSFKEKVGKAMQQAFSPPPGPRPNEILLSESRRNYLKELRYGPEIIEHIRLGDKCYKESLWRPALSMYIHGYEWAAIAYLEEYGDLDVVERERDGEYYTLAGREPTLINELREYVDIDQITLSRINNMNRAERRWMAHHKSGTILQEEVDAVRSRLGAFMEALYSEKWENT